MKTNRLISKEDAQSLVLAERIELEKQITDSMVEKIELPTIPPDWSFDSYRYRSPWRKRLFDFLGPLAGRTILDLGCGYHPTPVYFALAGARQVYACDVSPKAVEYVRRLADEAGVSDRVTAVLCPAEMLPFADGSFDLVHGEAVLHHLDLDLAGAEIARVLKVGGRAAFKDPLGQNPLLEFARDYIPYRFKSAAKGTDRPLKFRDIQPFGRHFAGCSYRGFGFLSMTATIFCGRGDSRLLQLTHRLDNVFLRVLPFMHRYCRFVVTCVRK